VEVPRLLQDAPQVVAVRESLKKEFARRDKDLVALQGDIKKIEEKLQRDGAILSDAETQRLERDLVAKQRKLKTAQNEFQEELSLRQNEELNKLRRQIAEVIIEVSKEDNLDLVLETGVVFASDRANITEKVLERLKAKAK
jgi:outer membrane protein